MPQENMPHYDSVEELPSEYQSLMQSRRWDAGEGIFFARQLEHIKAKSYDKKYPFLKARRLIPLNLDADPGAETITYEQYDQVGMAKIIANYADDLPRADVRGKEFTSKVRSIASAYGYNIQEIAAARMAGKPLVARKANAAKRANLIIENSIAWKGDAVHGLGGFLNNPNITEVVLAADGTGNSKKWANKTNDQIVRDAVSLATQVHQISKGTEVVDTLLLPIETWDLISNARLPNTGISVREWILSKNPHIKRIDWLTELETAGAGGTTRMVAYRYDPDAVTLEIPEDYRQMPVQERNLEFVVNTHQRCGGVLFYYPLSVAYADDI